MPTFSLIVPTIGRKEEFRRLLASLQVQTMTDFEVIVVDQNSDNRVVDVISEFPTLDIRRVTSLAGASRARNAGTPFASGEYITYPDDDAWYEPNLLERILRQFEDHPARDVITGVAVGEDGKPALAARWDSVAGPVTKLNVWSRGIEFTLFFRSSVVKAVGLLDENLGVGTYFGAGEGTDYLLRVLEHGHTIWFDPTITVGHPRKIVQYTADDANRALKYGRGIGRVLRQHKFPLWYVSHHLVRSFGGAVINLLFLRHKKARYYAAAGLGKATGFMSRGIA